MDYFVSNRQALPEISACRAKYLSAKGLNHVVHRLSPMACTDTVENCVIKCGDTDPRLAVISMTRLRNS
ncbi:MAG TPA: hypothetical protein VGG00_01315 [Rhodanobacter sp.]